LKKAAPDGELSEQDFMDWYVICKYTDAIIPPEDSGYPVFKTEHTSAMAQVTSCPPLVLAFSLSRVSPSHRPVLSLIAPVRRTVRDTCRCCAPRARSTTRRCSAAPPAAR